MYEIIMYYGMYLFLIIISKVFIYSFSDPDVKDLWFMGSIWPVTIVVVMYLYFVLKLGPEFMKYRNPFNIDRIVMIYNAVQVVFSLYLVKEVRHLLRYKQNK